MLCTGWTTEPAECTSCECFTASERLIQKHVRKYKNGAAELKHLIQQVLHHPDFDPNDVDRDMHQQLMQAIEEGDTEVIDLWKDRDGDQNIRLYKDLP